MGNLNSHHELTLQVPHLYTWDYHFVALMAFNPHITRTLKRCDKSLVSRAFNPCFDRSIYLFPVHKSTWATSVCLPPDTLIPPVTFGAHLAILKHILPWIYNLGAERSLNTWAWC